MGLGMGAEFWYRRALWIVLAMKAVDRLGRGWPDNFDDYYENLTDAIKDTAAREETQRTIGETQEGIRNTQQELDPAEALRKEAEDRRSRSAGYWPAKSITADVDGKISPCHHG